MYLKNYFFFFFKRVDCIKKIFKLSLNLVLSLTDVERGRERKGGREGGGEREGERGIRERGGVRKGGGEREGERIILALV